MARYPPITEYVLTDHARQEMARRRITEGDVATALSSPGQAELLRAGRLVYQSQFEGGELPKTYLLRVFVDIDREPVRVVTVYRTSKIERYWRTEE